MQFIANRKKFYIFSGITTLLSFLVFFTIHPNLGIDMTGGLQIEYGTQSSITPTQIKNIKEDITKNYTFEWKRIISDIMIYSTNSSSVRVDMGLEKEWDTKVAAAESDNIRARIPEFFKKHDVIVSEASFVSVGKSFWDFVLNRAYLNLAVCLLAIAFYLMFAFRKSIEGTSSFTFGAITLITLLHDVVVAAGIYIVLGLIFPGLKVDTFFVTAILTILGYSINDTIVILDRVRANYKDKKSHDKRSDKQVFEDSIQVSLRRSLYTSMMLVIVLVSMLFFGPEALRWFTILMLLGTIVGTYSSICLAAPLLYDINSRK